MAGSNGRHHWFDEANEGLIDAAQGVANVAALACMGQALELELGEDELRQLLVGVIISLMFKVGELSGPEAVEHLIAMLSAADWQFDEGV